MIAPDGASTAGSPYRIVLLVGFMGSGKTAVGPKVAERLGWTFRDVDEEVEAQTGSSIEALFEERGEPAFREVETRVTGELLEGRGVVVATGGGWPASGAGRLEGLPDDVLTVWLRVSPHTAVDRLSRDGRRRPLLQTDDPIARARELLEKRGTAYSAARLHLDTTDVSPDALADAIVGYVSGSTA